MGRVDITAMNNYATAQGSQAPTPPGWYRDQQNPAYETYWDGAVWTSQSRLAKPNPPAPARQSQTLGGPQPRTAVGNPLGTGTSIPPGFPQSNRTQVPAGFPQTNRMAPSASFETQPYAIQARGLPASSTRKKSTPMAAILGTVSGAAILLGSVLSWVVISSVLGEISVSGMEGDGKATIVLGILVLVAGLGGFQLRRTWLKVVAGIAGILAGGVAVIYMVNLQSKVAERGGDLGEGIISVSAGFGVYVVIVGAIVAVVAMLSSVGD